MPSPSTRASRSPETPFVYADVGRGQPIVLVHGSNTDHRIWQKHTDILTRDHRVIALTQRYFGSDPWPDDGQHFSIGDHAAALGELIVRLDVDAVTLVGWSYGAAVCLATATAHPKLAARMVLYEPAAITFVADATDAAVAADDRHEMTGAARAAAGRGDLATAVRLFMNGVDDRDDGFDTLPPEIQRVMLDNARMLPLLFAAPPPRLTCDDLATLRTSTVVARGDHTRTFYRVAADAAARCLPHAEVVLVPDATHLFPVREPGRFAALIQSSLN